MLATVMAVARVADRTLSYAISVAALISGTSIFIMAVLMGSCVLSR